MFFCVPICLLSEGGETEKGGVDLVSLAYIYILGLRANMVEGFAFIAFTQFEVVKW